MPRPKSTVRRTAICVRLPEDLVLRCDLLLADSYGRVKYGSRQRLFEALLRQWVETEMAQLSAKQRKEVEDAERA